jgi:hypothetical protein
LEYWKNSHSLDDYLWMLALDIKTVASKKSLVAISAGNCWCNFRVLYNRTESRYIWVFQIYCFNQSMNEAHTDFGFMMYPKHRTTLIIGILKKQTLDQENFEQDCCCQIYKRGPHQ